MKNIFPNVSPVSFTPNHLGIWKWSFPRERIGETVVIGGKKVKKMLTLDINIPEAGFAKSVNKVMTAGNDPRRIFAKKYPCVHACPGCFNNAQIKNPILRWGEIKSVVEQALALGLESVKFLGPGELLINPQLFEILDYFKEKNIVVGIFTKAAILGSDILAQKYHGISSQELVERLVAYPNITFLVGGRSFDPEIENKYIPTKDLGLRTSFNYHEARNLAIERLCEAGMNADPNKQRLSIQTNPVTRETIDGVFEIFRWGTERNIPVIVTTTMVSGKGHNLVEKQQKAEFERKYIDLATQIYSYLLQRGIVNIEQLKKDGISSYLGTSTCNQLTHGLYIHYDGEVWMCPGNDTENFHVHPNVRENSLLDIWIKSKNYHIQKYNNFCVKDGVSIPNGFYETVLEKIK